RRSKGWSVFFTSAAATSMSTASWSSGRKQNGRARCAADSFNELMRALYWDGRGLRFDSAYPTPGARIEDRGSKIVSDAGPSPTALVKVHLAGICSTDLKILNGYMSFTGVLGHEFVGSVSEGQTNGSASAWSVKSISAAAI